MSTTNPFQAAIDSYICEDLERVVASGLNVNEPFDHPYLGQGITPLWLAAERNEARMVEILLGAGADPNLPDAKGELPHFRTYRVEVVQRLLDAGARLQARDPSGHDLLMHCASRESGHSSYYAPIASLALARGADPNATAPDGRVALQIAMDGRNWGVARAIHGPRLITGAYANALEEALAIWDDAWATDEARRLDPSLRYDSESFGAGILPLHAACKANHQAGVRALLDAGADPNALDGEGNPPLLLTNSHEAMRALVERGADLHARDSKGRTLLMHAAEREQWNETWAEIARWAISLGIDPSVRDTEGRTALTIALKNRAKKVVTLIRGPLKLPQLLEQVSARLLRGQPVPPLLVALWGEYFKAGECFLSPIGETDLVSDLEEVPLDSYLAEPTLGRSWERMFQEMAFFATEADGGMLAFWLHTPGMSVSEAPILILDNEGCLHAEAPSLADYLVLGTFRADGRAGMNRARKWLKKQGVEHKASPAEIEEACALLPKPELRLKEYL